MPEGAADDRPADGRPTNRRLALSLVAFVVLIGLGTAGVLLAISRDGGGEPTEGAERVAAELESAPVAGEGDAADDPAIWIDPRDPTRSVVLATDKRAGELLVLDLDGSVVHRTSPGAVNNVDVVDGFRLGGRSVVLVAAGDDEAGTTVLLSLDPSTRRLAPLPGSPLPTRGVYGSCLARDPSTGTTWAITATRDGRVEQRALADDGSGRVRATLVATRRTGGQSEGCVADGENGALYVAEEERGVWRFPLDPGDLAEGRLVARVGRDGLAADVEGVALARDGDRGWLVVSSQGNDGFLLFDRTTLRPAGAFRVVDGTVDGVSDTDGLDVATPDLGSRFPRGLLVVQDGRNPGANQNFKFVRWDRALRAAGVMPRT